MLIDIEEFYKNYKEILLTCNENKIILPYILSKFIIPKEYDFTIEEHNSLMKRYEGNSEEIIPLYVSRREKELELFEKYPNNPMKKIYEYYESELLDFLKDFPKFRSILSES